MNFTDFDYVNSNKFTGKIILTSFPGSDKEGKFNEELFLLQLDLFKNNNCSSIVSFVEDKEFEILSGKNYFVKNKFKFHIITAKNIPFNIKINYNLNQIGSDRLANFIYVYSKKIKNCIIIDFGTATTFDVIKNNEYFGGLIFPGINLSMSSLIKSAELLKPSKISKSKKVVNRNTSASIQSGFYFGYLHAINGIIKQIKKENNFKPKKII